MASSPLADSLPPELRQVGIDVTGEALKARIAACPPPTVIQAWNGDDEAINAELRALGLAAPHLKDALKDSFSWCAEVAEREGRSALAARLREAEERHRPTVSQSAWMNSLDANQGGFSRLAAGMARAFNVCPFTGHVLTSEHCIPVSADDLGEVLLFYRFQSHTTFYILISGFAGSKSHLWIPSSNILIEAHSPEVAWVPASRIAAEYFRVMLGNQPLIETYLSRPTRSAMLSATISNIGHFFWNELSGIHDFDQSELLNGIAIGLSYKHAFIEPFDILRNARIKERLRASNWSQLLEVVVSNSLFCVRPTTTHVTSSLVECLREVAGARGTDAQQAAIAEARSEPLLLWVALRAHNKVWLNQVDSILLAIRIALEQYDSVSVFVDGLPDCMPFYAEIERQLPAGATLYCGIGINVYDTLNWACAVDAYIATIGSGLTFVTWIGAKPGIAQSERHHLNQLGFWKDVRADAPAPLAPDETEVEDVGEGLYGQGMYCDYRIASGVLERLMRQLLRSLTTTKLVSRFEGARLAARCSIPHAGSFHLDESGIIFKESSVSVPDWQIVSVNFPAIVNEPARLIIELDAIKSTADILYIGLNGGRHIGFVNLRTLSCVPGEAQKLQASVSGDIIRVSVGLTSPDGVIHLGVATPAFEPIQTGRNEAALGLRAIDVNDRYPKGSRPSVVALDVGAAGGIEPMWERFVEDVHFVLVEPDPKAASELAAATSHLSECTILPVGLANEDIERDLYLTRAPFCSSLLMPDARRLSQYSVGNAFDLMSKITVKCQRYETLYALGAPAPDYIKLDTQGSELQILEGMGGVLRNCLAIQVEAHFYPIYVDQPLIGDLVAFLDRLGFRLRDLRPCRSFDKDYLEVDCIFTRRNLTSDDGVVERKLAFIEEALASAGFDMSYSDLGFRMSRQFA